VELRRLPLAALRTSLEAREPEELRALIRVLRRDRRSGARQLARKLEQRERLLSREQSRLDALFALEAELCAAGVARIAGVDEVGMGPLAGPVVAAAVVLPAGARISGMRDSKQLAPAARAALEREIRSRALDVCVALVEPAEIDGLNIYRAGLEAMRRAVAGLAAQPDWLLVDARRIPGTAVPQRAVVRGDATVGSIAAASVVAKVFRDAHMRELDREFPGYGFARNAGYATAEHRRALREHGPCAAHRRSFAPVAAALAGPCPTR
jgi:ribonuclease HII